jgi:hypothetical protein
MAFRSFPGGRTSESAEVQGDVAPDFAATGTGQLAHRNDKAWSRSKTWLHPLVHLHVLGHATSKRCHGKAPLRGGLLSQTTFPSLRNDTRVAGPIPDAGNVVTGAQTGAQWGYRLLPLLLGLMPMLYIYSVLTLNWLRSALKRPPSFVFDSCSLVTSLSGLNGKTLPPELNNHT